MPSTPITKTAAPEALDRSSPKEATEQVQHQRSEHPLRPTVSPVRPGGGEPQLPTAPSRAHARGEEHTREEEREAEDKGDAEGKGPAVEQRKEW